MTELKTNINNSEILFLYDAKRANPNGDMDNENKPRMDRDTGTNLVSDVRLKRYIRDYLNKIKGKELFVTAEAKDAESRVQQILERKPSKKKPVSDEDLMKIADTCYDTKYFGAVLGTSGGNSHLVGPVQFNWGYSLNKVELQDSKTITSSFSSGEGVGKDYRVKYSLIAFNGGINALTAAETGLSQDDVDLLDQSIIKSIPLNRTRSKTGQTPRLYLRVELINKENVLNDLREYISLNYLEQEENVRSVDDYELIIDELIDYLKDNKNKIKKLNYWKDKKLKISDSGFENLKSLFKEDQLEELNY